MTFYMRKSLLTISAVLLAFQTLSARQIELGNLPGRDVAVRQGSSWEYRLNREPSARTPCLNSFPAGRESRCPPGLWRIGLTVP